MECRCVTMPFLSRSPWALATNQLALTTAVRPSGQGGHMTHARDGFTTCDQGGSLTWLGSGWVLVGLCQWVLAYMPHPTRMTLKCTVASCQDLETREHVMLQCCKEHKLTLPWTFPFPISVSAWFCFCFAKPWVCVCACVCAWVRGCADARGCVGAWLDLWARFDHVYGGDVAVQNLASHGRVLRRR